MVRRRVCASCVACVVLVVAAWAVTAQDAEKPDPVGPSPTLGMAPPEGAVAPLATGDMSQWHKRDGSPGDWPVEDGVITPVGGDIITNEVFEDAYIHLEWMEPDMPDAHGQARGNSGLGLQGRYELQLLDSYGVTSPGTGDCGAIYGQSAALIGASRPPLEWQTYDIILRSARLDDQGNLVEKPRITVLQNGRLIQNNVEIAGPTGIQNDDTQWGPGPLLLQDHGCPLKFRNVWIQHLPAKGNDQYEGS